jgi:hypothetical protein
MTTALFLAVFGLSVLHPVRHRIVSSGWRDETNLPRDETISRFWRRHPETANAYQAANETADSVGSRTRRQSNEEPQLLPRQCLSVGRSLDGRLIGKGPAGRRHFAYNGSPIVASAPEPIVVAAR